MRSRYLLALLLGPAGLAVLVLGLSGAGRGAIALAALACVGAGAALAVALSGSLARDAQALAAAAQRQRPQACSPENPAFDDLAQTLQRVAQHALAGSRALTDEARTLAAVLDGMEEGLWITDRDRTVVRHNAALRRMLPRGVTVDGERPLAIVRSAELADAVDRACAGSPATRLEISIEGDDRPRLLAVTVSPVGGGLQGSAAVFHDVTELRRLEKVREDFVANVSHELRTPVTAIRGYAETLQGGALADSAQAGRMVEIIHRQSIRLTELVEDLLELARLQAKRSDLRNEETAVAKVAASAADTVRPKADAKGVAVSVDVPEALVVEADDRGLETVLLNLLDNAVKYTPAGGEVAVRAQRRDDRCVIEVRDTGIGIEPKHLPRVFERFYRVDQGRSRDAGGTGLGLSIVKHLVNGMNGEVAVESQPGVGTTFTVVLASGRHSRPTG